MEATYRALCRHGYADLTMQAIADECDRSKASLHYHFDTKRELLDAFLAYLHDGFVERLDGVDEADPAARLVGLVDAALSGRDDGCEFGTAALELRAQAPYEPAFRERLAAFDESLADRVAAAVVDGVEAGRFRAGTDPAETAELVVTLVNGAHTRSVALDEPARESAARAVREHVAERLLADGEALAVGDPALREAPR